MCFKRRFFVLIIFIFLSLPVHAQGNHQRGYLTAREIERVKALKALLYGVDKQSSRETIEDLEKTQHPRINLEIREAMAKTYRDIVREVNVEGQKKKEWLYSMVCLNMAYLQFGGGQGTPGSTTELNRLIRRKLKEYLPDHALKQAGFLYSLE